MIRVDLAGICATDLEILRGYLEFDGTLGHEFVGTVLEAQDESLVGKRVVGGINCGCRRCEFCRSNDFRHCPERTVLGIFSRDGAFANMLTLPEENLVKVPDHVWDEEAVFAEPIAAALEITEQEEIKPHEDVLVMGDGKLGAIIAMVLREEGANVVVSGRSTRKLELLAELGLEILAQSDLRKFPVVIDATGSPDALIEAIEKTRPRGRLILKTTSHKDTTLNTSRIVVDEITVIGSRCGPMDKAIELIGKRSLPTGKLITSTFDLSQAPEAFRVASLPDSLKVLLSP